VTVKQQWGIFKKWCCVSGWGSGVFFHLCRWNSHAGSTPAVRDQMIGCYTLFITLLMSSLVHGSVVNLVCKNNTLGNWAFSIINQMDVPRTISAWASFCVSYVKDGMIPATGQQ